MNDILKMLEGMLVMMAHICKPCTPGAGGPAAGLSVGLIHWECLTSQGHIADFVLKTNKCRSRLRDDVTGVRHSFI